MLKLSFGGGGQGGSRIAAAFKELGYSACIWNTTEQDFVDLNIEHKLVLEYDLGAAGKDINIGKLAAEKNRTKIYNLFKEAFLVDSDGIFLCIGGGGKTGTGSILVAIDEAKRFIKQELKKNMSVGLIYTLPMAREPQIVKENAKKMIQDVYDLVSPLIVVDNELVNKKFPAPYSKFWKQANLSVAQIFHEFNIRSGIGGGLENFDESEFRAVIEAGGCLVFGRMDLDEIKSPSQLAQAFEDNLKTGLLATGYDYSTAKVAGAVLVANPEVLDVVMYDDIAYAFTVLSSLIGGKDVFRGVYADESVKGVRVYTIVGGLKLFEL